MASKAAEWAKMSAPVQLLALRFKPVHPYQDGVAMVQRDGGLYLELSHQDPKRSYVVGASLTPEDAIQLGNWLLDIFENQPA